MLATGGEANVCPKANSPHGQSVGNNFYRRVVAGVLYAETVQSALTGILKLVMGGLTSIILIVLGTVNLQLQGWFVSISLSSVLRTAAADIRATVWSPCG